MSIERDELEEMLDNYRDDTPVDGIVLRYTRCCQAPIMGDGMCFWCYECGAEF